MAEALDDTTNDLNETNDTSTSASENTQVAVRSPTGN